MIGIEKPKIETLAHEADGTYGKFVLEPLERGYGLTLGNSMRRVLLSSLPGYAITSVKIDNVLHEFSTIEGVKEDVTEIIMNIKNLAIKDNSDSDEPKKAHIQFEGSGVIKASDIVMEDPDVEIVNLDQTIATLSGGKDCSFDMDLIISKGRGYISADKNKKDECPIGSIAVDSIFTPVERVNLTVENTRVGQITDYDKLTLEVWTDGSITPVEAMGLAAKIINDHLMQFIDLSEEAKNAALKINPGMSL